MANKKAGTGAVRASAATNERSEPCNLAERGTCGERVYAPSGRYRRKVQRAAALSMLVLGAALGTSACTGSATPTGECLSYSCDEDGAKAMMWAAVDAAYTPSERAKKALEEAIDKAIGRMKKEQGFTPQTFELARGNMNKFLDEVPDQGEDPLGPAAEDLVQGTAKLCPLWPFC